MDTNLSSNWNKSLLVIKDNVSEQAFNTWFLPISALDYSNSELLLEVPSMFFYEYLEDKYSDLLRHTINRFFGENTMLMYRILVDNDNKTTTDIPTAKNKNADARKLKYSPFQKNIDECFDSQLNSRYTFDNFIEGKCNKLVRSAAINIASNPGKTIFNPLFVYGGSGFGKTHLLYALGNEIKTINANKRVLYISAHLFQLQYTDAVRSNHLNDFLNFYQNIDVLLIDDIQDFMSKPGTQNTFFHIFNHLHRLGKQIVLTSDCMPSKLKGMEERLLTRFGWGLSAEIHAPDFELKRNILQYHIRRDGIEIDSTVASYIAENVAENIRDIEGILVSIIAHSTINNEKIDVDFVKKVIGVTPKELKQITIDDICCNVCKYFSVSKEELYSNSRKREITQPRQVAMYLCRKYTNASLDNIGDLIGKRNHGTVIHSYKTIEKLLQNDKVLQNDISVLETKIKI